MVTRKIHVPKYGTQLGIVLLDDHEVVLRGLAHHLNRESDITVLAMFDNSRELLDYLVRKSAELEYVDYVVLIDYVLGPKDVDGVSLIRRLRIKFPTSRLLVVSAHHQPSLVKLAIMAGANGYIGKERPLVELVSAIRRVAAGESYVHPSLSDRDDMIVSASRERGKDGGMPTNLASVLTPRETGSAAPRHGRVRGRQNRREAQSQQQDDQYSEDERLPEAGHIDATWSCLN